MGATTRRSILACVVALVAAAAVAIPGSQGEAAGASGWQTVTGAGFSLRVPASWVVSDPSGNGTAMVMSSTATDARVRVTAVSHEGVVWAASGPGSFMETAMRAEAVLGESAMMVTMPPAHWPLASADAAFFGSARYNNLSGNDMMRLALEADRGATTYQLSADYLVAEATANPAGAYYPLRTFAIRADTGPTYTSLAAEALSQTPANTVQTAAQPAVSPPVQAVAAAARPVSPPPANDIVAPTPSVLPPPPDDLIPPSAGAEESGTTANTPVPADLAPPDGPIGSSDSAPPNALATQNAPDEADAPIPGLPVLPLFGQ
jgi:hypothetical protein